MRHTATDSIFSAAMPATACSSVFGSRGRITAPRWSSRSSTSKRQRRHQRRRTLLIHVVKTHQPQPADFEQVAETLGRHQPGARATPLDYGVGRDGRAVDQLPHAVAGDARLLEHIVDPGEDRLGVIAAGRQHLAGNDVPVLGDEDQVGKGAADIAADATRGISGHCLLT